MQDKKENKNSTLEDEADFADSTKKNQEEQKDNTLEEKEIASENQSLENNDNDCLLYTSPSPRDLSTSRMPSSA